MRIHEFNLALLEKWCWILYVEWDSLWFMVLEWRYRVDRGCIKEDWRDS